MSSGATPFGRPARFGFSPFDRLAELEIGTEAARAQRHVEAGRRILAELLRAAVAVAPLPAANWRV